jgi:hypothetical protein
MVRTDVAQKGKAEAPGLAGCNRLAQQERWKRCSGLRLFGSWSLLRDGWTGGGDGAGWGVIGGSRAGALVLQPRLAMGWPSSPRLTRMGRLDGRRAVGAPIGAVLRSPWQAVVRLRLALPSHAHLRRRR